MRCPNCERMITSKQFTQHTKACFKMPNVKDFESIVPTLSVRAMAQLWDVSKGAINARLRRTGLQAKNHFLYASLTIEQRAQIIALYQQNESLKNIGSKLDVSYRKVNTVIQRAIYHSEIKRRQRIYSKTAAKQRRVRKHHCVRCEIKLNHSDVLPGQGQLCGFCIGEVECMST